MTIVRRVIVLSLVLPALGAAGWELSRQVQASGQGSISEDEFLAARIGETQAVVESRLGPPLSPSDIPAILPQPAGWTCLYYEDDTPTIDGTTYRLCFRDGLLASKDGYGPLFDAAPLGSTAASQP
jgi:hypothetical protein